MQSKNQLFGLGLAAAVAIATYYGWKLFLFSTDDAYIAFRYVSNSMAGHGLTWNAPPFRPVEGYSSFLWVMLLREVWHLFGVEPPEAANYVSLLFGYATLFLGYRFIARMKLPEPLASTRWILLVLVMVGTLTNRTFLSWLSSGLSASRFTCCGGGRPMATGCWSRISTVLIAWDHPLCDGSGSRALTR